MKIFLSCCMLFAVSFGSLLGCSYPKDANPEAKQEYENREKLLATFNPILGNYSGTLKTMDSISQISVRFFVFYVKEGKDSNGNDLTRPVLRASLYQKTPPRPTTVFDVTFKPESNLLVMMNTGQRTTNASGAAVDPSTSDEIHQINAKIIEGKIVGDASRSSGPLGEILLELQDRSTQAPTENDFERYKSDLRQYFLGATGEYFGNVVPPVEEAYPYEIRVLVSSPASGSNDIPKLRAFYTRTDVLDNQCRQALVVTYRDEYIPPRVNMESPKEMSSGACYLSMELQLHEGALVGTYFDYQGNQYPIRLEKSHE